VPPKPRTTTVDLHGHDVQTAVSLALRRVAEAHNNGFDTIELVHGAADVEEEVDEGRGRIKWELRRMVQNGAFDAYAQRDSAWLKAGSIVLTLKRQARPRRESWSAEPRRTYR
jgi:hypothetical protein